MLNSWWSCCNIFSLFWDSEINYIHFYIVYYYYFQWVLSFSSVLWLLNKTENLRKYVAVLLNNLSLTLWYKLHRWKYSNNWQWRISEIQMIETKEKIGQNVLIKTTTIRILTSLNNIWNNDNEWSHNFRQWVRLKNTLANI